MGHDQPMRAQPKRADSRRTVDRILAVAIDVLHVEPNASMERIADAASTHRATLYRHFPNRHALVAELVDQAVAEGTALVDRAIAQQASSAALGAFLVELVDFGDRFAFLIGASEASHADADTVGLAALIEHWQDGGVLRSDLPAGWLATVLTTLAATVHRQSDDNLATAEARVAVLRAAFLEGAAPKPLRRAHR
jgi:AcrR family transcriptional regulator